MMILNFENEMKIIESQHASFIKILYTIFQTKQTFIVHSTYTTY